jgi:hypothetical protein
MGGIVGNHFEHGENTKIQKNLKPLLTPSQKFSIGPSWVILSHLIGYMEFLFLKLVVTFLACPNAATLPKETGVSVYSFTFTQSLNVLLYCVLGIYLVLQNT